MGGVLLSMRRLLLSVPCSRAAKTEKSAKRVAQIVTQWGVSNTSSNQCWFEIESFYPGEEPLSQGWTHWDSPPDQNLPPNPIALWRCAGLFGRGELLGSDSGLQLLKNIPPHFYSGKNRSQFRTAEDVLAKSPSSPVPSSLRPFPAA